MKRQIKTCLALAFALALLPLFIASTESASSENSFQARVGDWASDQRGAHFPMKRSS